MQTVIIIMMTLIKKIITMMKTAIMIFDHGRLRKTTQYSK